MVKITDPLKRLDLEGTPDERKLKHDKIEKQQIKNINLLATEEKKVNQTVRLPESLINSLKIYSKIHDISINSVIEGFLTAKFKDKKITRDVYETEEEVKIILPVTPSLIQMYIKEEVNVIANFDETEEGTINLNLFDKQAPVYKLNPSNFKIMTLQTTNNYLDSYDKANECYFDSDFYYDVLNELEASSNPYYENPIFKSHLGLIVLKLQDVTDERNIIIYFLLVHEYDNIIRTVRVISPEAALKLAEEVENNDIIEYIRNDTDVIKFNDMALRIKTEKDLVNEIDRLTEINNKYSDEIDKLKSELDKVNEEIEELRKHEGNPDKIYEYDSEILSAVVSPEAAPVGEENNNVDPETIKELMDKINSDKEIIKTWSDMIERYMNSYQGTLKVLDEYLENSVVSGASEDVNDVEDED